MNLGKDFIQHFCKALADQEDAEKLRREKTMAEGAAALKAVFGDRAASVAYFLHSTVVYEDPNSSNEVQRALDQYAPDAKPN